MADAIENHMVVDGFWYWNMPEEISKRLNGAGYINIETGTFVPKEDALDYALETVMQDKELKQEFLEWFYSGNWIKED